LNESLVLQHKDKSGWEDKDILILAESFCVSKEVIIRRLLKIGKATQYFYEEKREQYQSEYKASERKKEDSESFGRIPYHKKILSQTGKKYAGLVIDSYDQGKIGLLDVSEYLGVKTQHISKIRESLNPNPTIGE
jgi:Zn-dependent peptidase ImmA (M78 family)